MAKAEIDVHELYGQLLARIEDLRLEMHEMLSARPGPKESEASPNDVMGLIHAASAIEARFRQSEASTQQMLEPLRQSIEKDAERDAKVASQLDALNATNTKLLAALEEFTAVMRTPLKRTGMVNLPSGRVEMTITEHRSH